MKSSLFLLLISLFSACRGIDKLEDTGIVKTEDKEDIVQVEDLKYVMGKFNPETDENFKPIDIKHASREGLFLHEEAYKAFVQMFNAAKKDEISLIIKSATRNFDYQKGIWERKWTGQTILESGDDASKSFPLANRRALKILEYSSMPGTSRHHWGTDIDLNSFENEYFESGQGLKEYQWLVQRAGEFGFCQVYTPKGENRPNGYNEEKWHWSYLPIANKLLESASKSLDNEMISGFMGAEVATEIDVVNKYVMGISPNCKS